MPMGHTLLAVIGHVSVILLALWLYGQYFAQWPERPRVFTLIMLQVLPLGAGYMYIQLVGLLLGL
jgi:hypothetical protein